MEIPARGFDDRTDPFEDAEDGARRFAAHGGRDRYVYTRMGNPTTQALEDAIRALPETTAVSFASGCVNGVS